MYCSKQANGPGFVLTVSEVMIESTPSQLCTLTFRNDECNRTVMVQRYITHYEGILKIVLNGFESRVSVTPNEITYWPDKG